jgi:RHS repeat-associated protein
MVQQGNKQDVHTQTATGDSGRSPLPSPSLPKGGGAIRGIGEKFAANPVTGTGSMSVPIATSPGRTGFGPQLILSYDSGAGNGPFGFGWSLTLPAITRKTDKGLPQYRDAEESDVYILSGAEDLVPVLQADGTRFEDDTTAPGYTIHRYRPRVEGLFARIERWTNRQTGEIHWRALSKDNITTLYGKDTHSRIFDPSDPDPEHPQRIFSWLICESYDDKGNAIVYGYKEENTDGVDLSQAHEHNRTSANRYLKRIKYGYQVSRLVQPDLSQVTWMFEVVFDYGEHDPDSPAPDDPGAWLCRHDPFSSYRAGFEVRTYRLCQRILMFHLFPEEQEIGQDCLVRSTDFTYQNIRNNPDDLKQGNPVASFIASITQNGYRRQASGYLKKSLPPLEFTYSLPVVNEAVQEIDTASLENLPAGLDGTTYQWVDLDGEGVSGILTEQARAWFYKPNLGDAHFGPMEQVAFKPSLAALGSQRQHLLDLAGDGQLDLVEYDGPTPGFFERTQNQHWEAFKPFLHLPNIPWDDPNLRFVDLDGDGFTDILITQNDIFTWYHSLSTAGFGPAQQVHKPQDEERGPRLVFADGTQSIYLADMSGDGLSDLVRIFNGEVCYWPNLGYGHFGAKITMDNSPWFTSPDLFDQRRIRLADIDGSGNSDIIYLGHDGISLYFNQSGNSWSEPHRLSQFPSVDNLAAIMAMDLLGNGTACLVWSSPLPGNTRRSMHYIDLMGGQKPHLLLTMKNNLGAETHVQYASSTSFYLADKLAGHPWITRLPFPVAVVERVETYDFVSRNLFVTRYAYHHGYFDGVEREFRGFGMVEQRDTEEFTALTASKSFPSPTNLDVASHVPPVLTRTWFHTGFYFGGGRISRLFEQEYWHEPDLSPDQLEAMLLPDTVLPDTIRPGNETRVPYTLSSDEAREACRALKGSILRQEIYALDDTQAQGRPYSVSERNYTIELLQPQATNRYAVFFTHPRETVDYHYERALFTVNQQKVADPRVTHTMTLAVDDFGNVLQSVSIGYGRRYDDPNPLLTDTDRQKQKQTLLTYTENQYTNSIQQADACRTPLPAESRTYELLHVTPDANQPQVTNLFRLDEMQIKKIPAASDGLHDLPYEDFEGTGATTSAAYRRLIEHTRTLYRRDDLSNPLPLGQVEMLALPFEQYKLALTPGLLSTVYQRTLNGNSENLLPNPVSMLGGEGGYLRSNDYKTAGWFPPSDPDDNWWTRSGLIFYSPSTSDTFAQELAYASQHFFLPRRFQDPFGHTTTASYDHYDLLVQETRDPLGNLVTAGERDQAGTLTTQGNDYRVLQPWLLMDANRNRSTVAFDTLGLVVGTAVMGKPAESLGDVLTNFIPDLADAVIAAHLQDPLTNPQDILQQATSRLVYDLFAYANTQNDPQPQPAVVYTLARETHTADLAANQQTRIQHSFSYSDGFGREIQKKIQAEPGPLVENGPEINPRWLGSGWTIFNNKGKPVRQYEPFFSATHHFEFALTVGVSLILCYDSLGRVVATLHPNQTYEKVVFDPWQQASWDVNDTVLQTDPTQDPDVGDFFSRLPAADYSPTWYMQRQGGALGPQEQAAAQKTAVHANTPTIAYFDTMGRTFLTVAHNRFEGNSVITEEQYLSHVTLDIENNQRELLDARDRLVMRYDYDMLSNRIHQASMEAGERWMLNDVTNKPLYAWDSRGHILHTLYDALRRPVEVHMSPNGGSTSLVTRTVYGETQSNPEQQNLRGKVYQAYDQAGLMTTNSYDFKDNLLNSSRQLVDNSSRLYTGTVDWSTGAPLETHSYTSSTTYDALNRPVTQITPDNSIIRLTHNEANLLERVEANLCGAASVTTLVSNIDYNAKGQRILIEYGNGVSTHYTYDPQTFRLAQIFTARGAAFPGDCPNPPNPLCGVQNLHYTYDPMGNITSLRDDAQQTIYFRNRQVEPSADYTYDAIYRLIEASGREHLGQVANGGTLTPIPTSPTDAPRVGLLHPGDGNAMGRYLQQYVYDEVGNILSMLHRGTDPVDPGWMRTYTYNEPSQLEAGKISNRLTSTKAGSDQAQPYTYDIHGNMITMPHLPLMLWDYRDQLQATAQQVVTNGGTPETTYYVYDANGQRVRKVTERQAAIGQQPTRMKERVYLGSFEIYREYGGDGTTVTLERETLHIMDDKQRVALVETRTQGNDGSPAQLIRYQFSNHLGSTCLELDDQGQIISYEEYYPYGSTSYQAVRKDIEVPLKRYRYTGKERDEETGLCYHDARYYAPWLGRWTSPDPSGILDGANLYRYSRNAPTVLVDASGKSPVEDPEEAARKASVEKLKSIEQQTESIEQQTRQLGNERVQLEREAEALGERLSNAKDMLKRIERTKGTGQEIRAQKKLISKLEQQLDRTYRESENIQDKLENLEQKLESLNQQSEIEHAFLEDLDDVVAKANRESAEFNRQFERKYSDFVKRGGGKGGGESGGQGGGPPPEPGGGAPPPESSSGGNSASTLERSAAPPEVSPSAPTFARAPGSVLELDPKPSGEFYVWFVVEALHDVAEKAHVTREYRTWPQTVALGPGATMTRAAYEAVEGAKMTPGLILRAGEAVKDFLSEQFNLDKLMPWKERWRLFPFGGE